MPYLSPSTRFDLADVKHQSFDTAGIPRLLDHVSPDLEELSIPDPSPAEMEEVISKLGRFSRIKSLALGDSSPDFHCEARLLDAVPSLRRLVMYSNQLDLVLVRPHPNLQTLSGSSELELSNHLQHGHEMDVHGRFKDVCRVVKQHPDWHPSLRFIQAYDCTLHLQTARATFRPLAASLAEVGLVLLDEEGQEHKQAWIDGGDASS